MIEDTLGQAAEPALPSSPVVEKTAVEANAPSTGAVPSPIPPADKTSPIVADSPPTQLPGKASDSRALLSPTAATKSAPAKGRVIPWPATVAAALILALAAIVAVTWAAVFAPTPAGEQSNALTTITPAPNNATAAPTTPPPTLGSAAAPARPASPIGPSVAIPFGFNLPIGDKATSPFESGRFGFATPDAKSPTDSTKTLAQADLYLAEGRLSDAETTYTAAGQNPAARFGLAHTYQMQGRTNDAITAYKDFLTAYPNDDRSRLAIFELAELAKGSGLWQNAIDYYTQYAKISDTIAGYVYADIGDCYTGLGDTSKADTYYALAAVSSASNLARVSAKEKEADNRLSGGDTAGAITAYKNILDLAQVSDYRATIGFKLAGAYKVAGQTDAYVKQLRDIAQSYPDTTGGAKALKALSVVAPDKIDDYDRARLAISSTDWATASGALERYLGVNTKPKPPTPVPATDPAASKQAQALLMLGQAYLNQTKRDLALNAYKQVTLRYPNLSQAQDAYWKIGTIQEDVDNNAAIAAYHTLWSNYKNGTYAEDALVAEARLQWTPKPAADSLKALTPLVSQLDTAFPASMYRAELYTRLAELKEATGDTSGAKKDWQEAANSPAHDYYAIRAAERLAAGGNAAYSAPKRSNALSAPDVYSATTFAAELPGDQTAMEAWLVTWAKPKTPTPPTGTPSTTQTPSTAVPSNIIEAAAKRIQTDPGVLRLVELHRLGRETDAQREAQEALDRYTGSPLELYQLALVLSQQGQYYWSVGAARALYDLSPAPLKGFTTAPRLLRKLLYPLYFQDSVLDQSKHYNVDPLLVTAMIKQESAFKADAQSWVGARGLTQIMPETAQGIAGNLKKSNFDISDLNQPALAIEFGTYYLTARLKDFGGNPFVALAAYNAGSGNAQQWVAANPPSANLDAFVSGITFAETRNYVKICYENYVRYREIYTARP